MKNTPLKEHIRQANYLFALHHLGVLDNAPYQLQQWCQYRTMHSDFIKTNHQSDVLTKMDISGFDQEKPDGNFFLLFHQGFYFTIPHWLVKHYGYAGSRFIMTEDSFDQQLAEQCAKAFDHDFKAIIIDEKGYFIREVIKAKRQNYCIFLLTDLPFGYTDSSVDYYQQPFGRLKYRAGFAKIAKILKQQPHLITSEISEDFTRVHYEIKPVEQTEDLLSRLGEIYQQHYLTAERLDDLNKMCEFNQTDSKFNHEFEYQDKSYRYYPATEKLYSITAPLADSR